MEKPIRLALIGASGKMGQEILKAASLEEKCSIVSTFSHSNPENDLDRAVQDSDVVIDFSSKELFDRLIQAVLKYQKPLVIGTTGLSQDQGRALQEASQKIPVFFSANFSLGVALVQEMCAWLASRFGRECDIDIVETHHAKKKDKPSGTALMLASVCSKKQIALDTVSKEKRRDAVVIHSLRTGDVIGIHEIFFITQGEVIALKHEALDRGIFAKGAIKAALWLADKNPGFFSMDSLFKVT